MPNNDKYKDPDLSSEENRRQETANRVDELINLVENLTRTERHLEQHSDIASDEQIRNAEDLQREREEQISNLKNKIIYGDGGPSDDVEGLERNMVFANGYLNHNADHMSEEDLQNLKQKQENRRETLDRLE